MKKTFIGIMALAISLTAFVSCELDAPEINFSQTTTVEMDFTEVIDAIKDQTLSITQKLEILENAMKAQNTTLEQKLAAIETAVKEGVADIAAKQDLIKAAIDALGTDMDAAVKAIEDAIKSQTTSLETKLDLIETAVKNGVADIIKEQELVKEAIIESLDEHFAETQESLDAVNKAFSKILVDANIYEYDKKNLQLIMSNSAWEVLNSDEELAAAFMAFLPVTNYTFKVMPSNADYTVNCVANPDKTTLRLLRQKNLLWYNKNDKTVVPEADTEGQDYDKEILVPAVGVIKTYDVVTYTCTLVKVDGSDLGGATFGSYNRWLSASVYYGPFYDMSGKTEGNLRMDYANDNNIINYLPQVTMNISVPAGR